MIWYFNYNSILAFLWWNIVCSSHFQHISKFTFVHDWYHIVCQVQWDEPSSIMRPERVSHWELEPLVATTPVNSQPMQRNKRPRPSVLPSPTTDITSLGLSTVHLVFPHSISQYQNHHEYYYNLLIKCNNPYIFKLENELLFLRMKPLILWFIFDYMTYNEYPSDKRVWCVKRVHKSHLE